MAVRAGLTVLVAGSLVVRAHAATPTAGAMTLHEAYLAALRQSEQVQIALANRGLAETNYTGALAIMGPTIGITGQGRYQNLAEGNQPAGVPKTGLQNPYYATVDLNLNQPLLRRQVFDARRAAGLGVEAAEQTVKRVRQQLMMDVTTAFVGVLQARQQLAITQAAIKRAETQLQSAASKVKLGAVLKTAQLLAQIDVNRAQIATNVAERAMKIAESVFTRLVGMPPPPSLLLPSTPAVETLDAAVRRAQSERADVRALAYVTLQAKALVSNAQSKLFWPTLDLQASAGYRYFGDTNTANPPLSYPSYGIGGAITVPLFQGGDEWVQLKLQRQRVGVAAFNESFLKRQAADDVRQALVRLEAANRQISIADEQQKVSVENYQGVAYQYKVGREGVGVLELVTAQAAVLEAETNKLAAQYDRELAAYQLLFADGRLDL